MWELLASVRALLRPAASAVHLPWLSAHRADQVVSGPSVARELAAGAAGRLPGFLAPTPDSPLTGPAEELARLRATPAEQVRRDLAAVYGDRLPAALVPLREAPERGLGALAEELAGFWERALAPSWPRLRALLESDIHHRARVLTERGPAAMLGEVHQGLTYDPAAGTLRVALRWSVPAVGAERLAGRGLVLVPSAFAWPDVYVKTSLPWTPVIRYPARGVGALWEAAAAADDLAAVLGASRARLLDLLETPAGTVELAHRAGLAPGGVSAHLHRLARAGLVAPHRTGRTVLYARTARGEALYR
ncbi:DUF5937 family protein [Streptomyces sp. TLI_171]|uniref:DUF5937 family protein n=1 Tax=Streptomyces sp. TLI_171 TaxID=1938859 RepID=UPI000C19C59A|nr:DUF5937 family protein [Streptomyces sp. TLI_171]